MSFLNLNGKTILVTGVANRKSVAYFIAKTLLAEGATVVLSVLNETIKTKVQKLFPDQPIFLCNVEDEADITRLAADVAQEHPTLHGLVHSIAFADYSEGLKPFHETKKEHFLQAVDISCFSLTALANAFRDQLAETASVVAISISTTRMAAEPYGYMAPVKAALDSSVAFLAKSFSRFSKVRFNTVNASLLKTSASAGIPGYLDYYLYAEQVIPRKEALQTEEVANVAVFLLSERSSGINAQHVVVDAGMSINFFDHDLVKKVVRL